MPKLNEAELRLLVRHLPETSALIGQEKSTGLGLGLVRGFIEHELGGALTTRVEAKRRSHQLELPLVESDS